MNSQPYTFEWKDFFIAKFQYNRYIILHHINFHECYLLHLVCGLSSTLSPRLPNRFINAYSSNDHIRHTDVGFSFVFFLLFLMHIHIHFIPPPPPPTLNTEKRPLQIKAKVIHYRTLFSFHLVFDLTLFKCHNISNCKWNKSNTIVCFDSVFFICVFKKRILLLFFSSFFHFIFYQKERTSENAINWVRFDEGSWFFILFSNSTVGKMWKRNYL